MIALYGWVRSFFVTVIGVRFGFGVFRIGLVSFAVFRFVLAEVQRFQCVFNLLSGAEADTGTFDQSFFHVLLDEYAVAAQSDIKRTDIPRRTISPFLKLSIISVCRARSTHTTSAQFTVLERWMRSAISSISISPLDLARA